MIAKDDYARGVELLKEAGRPLISYWRPEDVAINAELDAARGEGRNEAEATKALKHLASERALKETAKAQKNHLADEGDLAAASDARRLDTEIKRCDRELDIVHKNKVEASAKLRAAACRGNALVAARAYVEYEAAARALTEARRVISACDELDRNTGGRGFVDMAPWGRIYIPACVRLQSPTKVIPPIVQFIPMLLHAELEKQSGLVSRMATAFRNAFDKLLPEGVSVDWGRRS